MGTFKHVTDVISNRVFGIRIANGVVGGVVTATSMHLLRTLNQARYLLERLVWRMGAGQLAMAKCHAGSAASAATCDHRPSWSGQVHLRRPERLIRPRSAGGLSRF